MIDLSLKGKQAVVTGASLGIGEAVVRLLADHGADVTFCARNKEALNKLSKLLNEADLDYDPKIFRRYGSNRKLYNFDLNNIEEY